MRKLLMALMLSLLPVLGMASIGPASAAAPSNMTLLDRLSTAESDVDQVRYRRYRCYNVCIRRNYRGYCTRSVRRCYRRGYRYYRRW